MHNTFVSVFSNCTNSTPIKTHSLYELCISSETQSTVKLLRSLEEGSEEWERLKKGLLSFTPSVICTQRNNASIVEHSGYICLDFDHIDDPEEVKCKLAQLAFITFAALSCSGKGVYAMVKIDKVNLHKQYYKALVAFFGKLGLVLDASCADLVRLRFMSYDPCFCYNEYASVWDDTLLPKRIPVASTAPYDHHNIDSRAIYIIRDYVVQHGVDITKGRHTWLAIGSYIMQQLGVAVGEGVFRAYSQFHPHFDEQDFIRTCKDVAAYKPKINIGALLNACVRSGVPHLTDLLKPQQ